MAVKVHGNLISTATRRVLACLIEKELEYELVPINMAEGEHKKEPFLSLNPFGQVPAFEDGDLLLFESRAITQYIVQTYADEGTQLIIPDTKKMAIAWVWMEVEAHQFDPTAAKLVHELVLKPLMFGLTTDDAVVKDYKDKLAKILDIYEARLTKSKYLGGYSFSLADLHHLPAINNLMATKVKALFEARPHVQAWIADISARPAWVKVCEMQQNSR